MYISPEQLDELNKEIFKRARLMSKGGHLNKGKPHEAAEQIIQERHLEDMTPKLLLSMIARKRAHNRGISKRKQNEAIADLVKAFGSDRLRALDSESRKMAHELSKPAKFEPGSIKLALEQLAKREGIDPSLLAKLVQANRNMIGDGISEMPQIEVENPPEVQYEIEPPNPAKLLAPVVDRYLEEAMKQVQPYGAAKITWPNPDYMAVAKARVSLVANNLWKNNKGKKKNYKKCYSLTETGLVMRIERLPGC